MTGGEDEGEEGTTGAEHDFENPLYVEGTQGDQANGVSQVNVTVM